MFFNFVIFSLVKQKQLLGPGTYNINDFIDQMAKKPGSTRGVCETREARFDTTKMVSNKCCLKYPYPMECHWKFRGGGRS